MSEEPRGFWQDGRIIDEVVRPWRPRLFVVLVLVALVLVDLLLAAALGARPAPLDIDLRDDDDARRVLERAAAADESWLLVGDSVLAGDVMAGKVDDWEHQRVIDHMRRELAPGSDATFHQIALNGLLPVDALRIVSELDRIDPGGRVSVVLELNPRFASPHYAEQRTCTRAWLCDLGVPLVRARGVDWLAWAKVTGHATTRWLLDHLPITRHRRELDLDLDLTAAPQIADPQEVTAPPDELEGRARLVEHYRAPVLGDRSAQIAALKETVGRLRAAGRRAVFFSTPVEDAFAAAASAGEDHGQLVARWSELVDAAGPSATELVNLDSPLFTTPLFLDHCHLGAQGNRLLAINLLHEMGLGLAQVPQRTEMAHPEGPDATLVARIAPGSSDGATWQAAFERPEGVAVAPGGERVVIADTANHCLRELVGNLQTVRTVAGACGEKGFEDGPHADARLSGPRAPFILGDDVYFTTEVGKSLRRLRDGRVFTTYRLTGPRWSRIQRVRSAEGVLYLLDAAKRILRFDPARHHVDVIATVGRKGEIRAFDVTQDGRVFIVDEKNRIWVGTTRRPITLGATDPGAELVFANTASKVLPDTIGAFFPFAFDEVQLQDVVDVHWVDRYEGLLVQDDVPLAPKKSRRYVTERIHLRFFSLTDNLVYPWLKPLAFGGGHIVQNVATDSLVTDFHEGSMALDPESLSLFYLEKRRSRLFRMSDGLWGAAVTGNVPTRRIFNETRELFGAASGEATLARFRPDRYLDRRIESRPRSGPFLGVMVGSSMIGSSDNVGMYSMARRVELHLRDALGYRDRIRFDLVVRSYAGATWVRTADAVEELVDTGLLPDVILVELRASRKFFRGVDNEAQVLEHLARMRTAAERAGALLVLFDNTAMMGRKRDALRLGSTKSIPWIELLRDTGVTFIDPSDAMLEDHFLVSPWSSPPFAKHHASPWGVDATAERYAGVLYPLLRDLFVGRVPSRLRGEVEVAEASDPLAPIFEEVDVDWDAHLLAVNPGTMQRQYARGHLELFVDLEGLEIDPELSEAELERAALSCVRAALLRDPASASAERVTIRLARFANYDEYGQGVLRGAKVRYEDSLDAAGLRALVGRVADRVR